MPTKSVERTPELGPANDPPEPARQQRQRTRTERGEYFDKEIVPKAASKAQTQQEAEYSESESDGDFNGEAGDPETPVKKKPKKNKNKRVVESEEDDETAYARNLNAHQSNATPKPKPPVKRLSDVITKNKDRATSKRPSQSVSRSSAPPDLDSPEQPPPASTDYELSSPTHLSSSRAPTIAAAPSSPTTRSSGRQPQEPTDQSESPVSDEGQSKKPKKLKKRKHSPSSDNHKKKAKRNSGATAPRAGRSAASLADDEDGTRKAVLELAFEHYRAMLASKAPFPDLQVEEQMARWAWSDARKELELDVSIKPDALKLIKQRTSQMRGELVTAVKHLICLYGFDDDCLKIKANSRLYRELMEDDNFLYQDHTKHYGLFYHPILLRAIRRMWFKSPSDEGVKYQRYFKPIRAPTIALVFTAVYNALEEWEKGIREPKPFQACMYGPIFERISNSLDEMTAEYSDFVKELGNLLFNKSLASAGGRVSSDSKNLLTAVKIKQAVLDAKKIQEEFRLGAEEPEPESEDNWNLE
ncbi:hypothetical protein FRC03_012803 [Tulasnella sp. 419]|nr:hypothetical protein FRC03_012803 [Tulasnella sp. 419]